MLLMFASSHINIKEDLPNYICTTKNKCLILIKCTCRGQQESMDVRAVKSKLKVLRHFKVDHVLKMMQHFKAG